MESNFLSHCAAQDEHLAEKENTSRATQSLSNPFYLSLWSNWGEGEKEGAEGKCFEKLYGQCMGTLTFVIRVILEK